MNGENYTKEQIEKSSFPDLASESFVEPKTFIKRLDTSHGRTYYDRDAKEDERVYLYSSTTILDNVLAKGYGFNKWLGDSLSFDHANEYGAKRAHIGTMTHALCQYLIMDKVVDTRDGFFNEDTMKIEPIPAEVKKRLTAFIEFCQEYNLESMATEISLYTDDRDEDGQLILPWAGTADNVFKIGKGDDQVLAICDIKTGKPYKHSHELQLTSYKMLWDHIHGPEHGEIEKLFGLYLTDKGKAKFIEYDYRPGVWIMVYEIFEYLLKNKRGAMPKIKEKEELPDIYTLKKEKGETENG